jgi:RNA polymerase sigma-70 factor (ECF subfamily)
LVQGIALPADDEKLVERAAAGDAAALATLFERWNERLRKAVLLRLDPRLSGRLDPSDILQDTFLDATRRLPEYVAAPAVSLPVWLRSLALQRLVDLHRRHLGAKMRTARREIALDGRRDPPVSADSLSELLIDPARSPGSEVAQREKHRRVHQALAAM